MKPSYAGEKCGLCEFFDAIAERCRLEHYLTSGVALSLRHTKSTAANDAACCHFSSGGQGYPSKTSL